MSRPSAAAGGSGSASSSADWPARAADTIVTVVGSVRDRTTGPAINASRAVVYGTLAAILGLTALVLLCIVLLRGVVLGIDGLLGVLDIERSGRAVWIAYLLLGGVFSSGGWTLWRKAWAVPTR